MGSPESKDDAHILNEALMAQGFELIAEMTAFSVVKQLLKLGFIHPDKRVELEGILKRKALNRNEPQAKRREKENKEDSLFHQNLDEIDPLEDHEDAESSTTVVTEEDLGVSSDMAVSIEDLLKPKGKWKDYPPLIMDIYSEEKLCSKGCGFKTKSIHFHEAMCNGIPFEQQRILKRKVSKEISRRRTVTQTDESGGLAPKTSLNVANQGSIKSFFTRND
jgi:hypothetical protein